LKQILQALTRYSANARELPVNGPPLFTGAKPDVFSRRLNVASNRLSDAPWKARLGRLARDGVVWATLNNRPNDRLARASNSPMPGEHMHMRMAIKASLTVDQILRLLCMRRRRTL
jgi:hypothetical protein